MMPANIANYYPYLLSTWLFYFSAQAATVELDLKAKYSLTLDGVAKAITDAKAHFSTFPDDVVVIRFPEGTIDFYGEPARGTKDVAIDVSKIKPGAGGRLVFSGAGRDATTLVFNNGQYEFSGREVYRLTIKGLHLTRNRTSVSQGHVISAGDGKVVLDIQEGFPAPADLVNDKFGTKSHYLRKYTDSRTDPQMVEENNAQVHWTEARLVEGHRWELSVTGRMPPPYQPGNLVAIKSKMVGQTYWFAGGDDIRFEDVKWTQQSRGVFRGGIGHIAIVNCEIARSPAINGQVPCLSTPDGGPQIGQPDDPPTSDNLVDGLIAVGTGDDSVAFFNGRGTVRNCRIRDSYARGILQANSPDVVLENNTVLRCPILKTGNSGAPER